MALNKNNAAVKRIMQEARELANDPCTDYSAAPLEDDIFEWHCTLRGPSGTEFEGGLYHFRILLPAEYPFRPPSIMILTPNGRFELNTKICISFTNYHEELWQPAWGVRTAIIGLQGFFPLKGQAAVGVGSIEYPANERKRLATLSREWTCPTCQVTNLDLLPDPPEQNRPDVPTMAVDSSASQEDAPTALPTALHQDASHTAHSSLTRQSPPSESLAPSSNQDLVIPNNQVVGQLAETIIQGVSVSSIPPQSVDIGSPAPASPSHLPPIAHREATPSPTPVQSVARSRQISQKPPFLLDSAICVLVVLVFTIICRRMV